MGSWLMSGPAALARLASSEERDVVGVDPEGLRVNLEYTVTNNVEIRQTDILTCLVCIFVYSQLNASEVLALPSNDEAY